MDKYSSKVIPFIPPGYSLDIPRVFHVGSLDVSKKSRNSYEGAGLSVSLHPKDWQKIARLSGKTFILSKPGARFVDFRAFMKKNSDIVRQWGVEQGYLINKPTYRYYFTYDETGKRCYFEFETKEEAQGEIGEDDYRIRVNKKGCVATELLCLHSFRDSISLSEVLDLTGILFCEAALDYDGVWWNELYKPELLSCPRGVIFLSKINDWSIFADS